MKCKHVLEGMFYEYRLRLSVLDNDRFLLMQLKEFQLKIGLNGKDYFSMNGPDFDNALLSV